MKNKAIWIVVSLFILFAVLSSFVILPRYSIRGYELEEIPATYEVQRTLEGFVGTSFLFHGKHAISQALEALPYVKNPNVSFSGRTVYVSQDEPLYGVILATETDSLFYDGEFSSISRKDVLELMKCYSLVRIDDELFSYSEKYGFPKDFVEMLDALAKAKHQLTLITIADYDNNKTSIYGGTLRVRLDDANSILEVVDFRDQAMILEALGIIQDTYRSSKVRLTDEIQEYVLSNAQLTRKKR